MVSVLSSRSTSGGLASEPTFTCLLTTVGQTASIVLQLLESFQSQILSFPVPLSLSPNASRVSRGRIAADTRARGPGYHLQARPNPGGEDGVQPPFCSKHLPPPAPIPGLSFNPAPFPWPPRVHAINKPNASSHAGRGLPPGPRRPERSLWSGFPLSRSGPALLYNPSPSALAGTGPGSFSGREGDEVHT